MKVTDKGQVTIPAPIRSYLGIGPSSEVSFDIRNGQVILRRTDADAFDDRISQVRGRLQGQITTEQWMAATRGD